MSGRTQEGPGVRVRVRAYEWGALPAGGVSPVRRKRPERHVNAP
ncbi:hypothetical protein ABZW44_00525 [Streptomyces mirabilis]